jgi:hypothetical protein
MVNVLETDTFFSTLTLPVAGKSRLSCQDHHGNLSISNETTYAKGERSRKITSDGFRQVAARDILQHKLERAGIGIIGHCRYDIFAILHFSPQFDPETRQGNYSENNVTPPREYESTH